MILSMMAAWWKTKDCVVVNRETMNIEIGILISALNKNMQDLHFPSWVSCLDESISIWNMKWTCPGYDFCSRKLHPASNEYQIIADAYISILYATEIAMGKDTP